MLFEIKRRQESSFCSYLWALLPRPRWEGPKLLIQAGLLFPLCRSSACLGCQSWLSVFYILIWRLSVRTLTKQSQCFPGTARNCLFCPSLKDPAAPVNRDEGLTLISNWEPFWWFSSDGNVAVSLNILGRIIRETRVVWTNPVNEDLSALASAWPGDSHWSPQGSLWCLCTWSNSTLINSPGDVSFGSRCQRWRIAELAPSFSLGESIIAFFPFFWSKGLQFSNGKAALWEVWLKQMTFYSWQSLVPRLAAFDFVSWGIRWLIPPGRPEQTLS